MEEPEIALAPHTQRRIATYLLTKTTQCFVTSHSPYVIETFDPDRIVVLRRDNKGTVTGKRVTLSADVKAKTYRRYIRRGFAEAMLGRGVVVAEGITEQLALQAVAEKLESSDDARYPLDLSGITVITTDGDGSIAEFGRFFVSLDLPTFAFFDKRERSANEQKALDEAGFQILNETAYAGMEDLLAAEVPLKHQWAYLEGVRESGVAPKILIPAAPPGDDKIRNFTRQVLKDSKGWGRAADLIERCEVVELPPTIVGFLERIYAQFPRPKRPEIAGPDGEAAEDPAEGAKPAGAVEPQPAEDA